jgi:chromosomal replication initiator protein
MNKYELLWQKILEELESIYDPETFNDLFRPLKSIYRFHNNHIYILVENEFTKNRINQIHIKKINELAKRFHKDELVDFIFITNTKDLPSELQEKSDYSVNTNYEMTGLNANYTFPTFVVGKSNNYAFSVSMIVADQLGTAHNPLYIFGDVGLGKTHLMQAIGNKAIENNINSKVLYVKSDIFVEEYYAHFKNQMMDEFNEKYRSVDVLLIDDIQMLSGATQTQLEFFKLFEILHSRNKQIVITSDKPASELKKIMDRLTSRFQWGLSVDIKIPDAQHRLDILKKKLAAEFDPNTYQDVPIDALEYIASVFSTNIRELEGALNRAMTYTKIHKLKPSVKNFKIALESLVNTRIKSDQLNENNYDKIQSVVADFYSIKVEDMIGKKRDYKSTLPRHIAMYLIKYLYDVPYKTIGELFGNRDHSSVLSACSKIENELESDPILKKAIEDITKKLGVEK